MPPANCGDQEGKTTHDDISISNYMSRRVKAEFEEEGQFCPRNVLDKHFYIQFENQS